MFPIKNGLKHGDALMSLLFNFALEYSIRRVQLTGDVLKLNDTHQRLVFAGYVNILRGNVHNIQKNTVVATKKIGLEINADKSKYMIMSGDQNAG
jgi:lipopolysaccharide export system protein LptA